MFHFIFPSEYSTLLSSLFCSFSLYSLLLLCSLISTVLSQLLLSLLFPSTLLSHLYPAAARLSYLYCSFPAASFFSCSPLYFFPIYTLLLFCCLISTVLSQLLLSFLVPLYTSFPSIPCCCSVVLSLLFFPSCFFLFSFPCTHLSLLYPAAVLLSYIYCSFPTASFSFRSPLHFFPFHTLLLLCCLISTVLSQLLLSHLVRLYTSFPSIPRCCSVALSLLFFPSCFFLYSFPSTLKLSHICQFLVKSGQSYIQSH